MASDKLIIVDDEKSMRDFLEIMLRKEGYDVCSFSGGEEAISYFKENKCDLVITDMKMQGMDGVELLKEIKSLSPEVPVIMVTAYASVDTAIEAMKSGAYDYFTKPFNVDEIKLHIKRALETRRLEKENLLLKKTIKSKYGFSNLVGTSPQMVDIYGLVMSVASTRTNVFITGESGTGKELVARSIHSEGDRRDAPFVALNCGAIPENLIESELFGYQKGAFTGAVSNKEGLCEFADTGTLFLDEITELPLLLQVKLLRFIQERTLRRVGGTTDIPVDVRIVASSNRDIEEEVKLGTFREDLFYRLNVIRISVPPLRERKEDIACLAKHFLDKYSGLLGKDVTTISKEVLDLLEGYSFPGNVRELENIMERAVALEKTSVLITESLPPHLIEGAGGEGGEEAAPARAGAGLTMNIPDEGIDIEEALCDFERAMFAEALRKSGGVKTKAAKLLGLSFRSFRCKLGKYEE